MTTHGPLAGYRALDLTDHRGALAGRFLADLGVDVLKVEPPGGDVDRAAPPWAGDRPGPTRSLAWLCGNFGKRTLMLDVERPDGRAALRRLAASADFVLESFAPGFLGARGLGWEVLCRDNPRLILTSITGFGQSGPRAHWKATDLTLMAAGGSAFVCGDRDRPPLRIGIPQAWGLAGAEAVIATLIAHSWRERTGDGQWVDVAAQGVIVRSLMSETGFPHLHDGFFPTRHGPNQPFAGLRRRAIFPAKDGHVVCLMIGGPIGAASMRALVAWMEDEGGAPHALRDKAWESWDYAGLHALGSAGMQAQLDEVEAALVAFFARHTKAELYDEALRRRVMLSPVSEARDLLESPQLAARDFFVTVDQPGLGHLVVPGPFARFSATPATVRSAPPLPAGATAWAEVAPRPPSVPEPVAPAAPFAGLRVVDFTWSAAGPIATRYLAAFGADVIRVESARRPDPVRNLAPWKDGVPGRDRSHLWANYNAGKRGVTLNLDTAEGRRLGRELIRRADVVAEAFTPGVMARWGLDYATLAREQPELVVLSTCQQGQTGPHAGYPGYGTLMAGLAGFYGVTGWPDRDPVMIYGAYTDFVTCVLAGAAVVAALDHRRRSGRGQWIDLAQLEAALQLLAPALLEEAVNGRGGGRRGNEDPAACPHGVYPCAGDERWVAIAVETDAEWRALAGLLGREDWTGETLPARRRRARAIDAAVADWTRARTAAAAAEALQALGIPAAPVATCADLHADPQLAHRGFFVAVDHPVLGRAPIEAHAFDLPRCPPAWRAAPTWGQHNDDVFGGLLGLPRDEVDRLRAAQVIW